MYRNWCTIHSTLRLLFTCSQKKNKAKNSFDTNSTPLATPEHLGSSILQLVVCNPLTIPPPLRSSTPPDPLPVKTSQLVGSPFSPQTAKMQGPEMSAAGLGNISNLIERDTYTQQICNWGAVIPFMPPILDNNTQPLRGSRKNFCLC